MTFESGRTFTIEGVSTYTIGEVAERSGFSASALRYYEDIGLVRPASRTESGYRIYDDHTVVRLAFIARAKQLGCSLDEINDLVSVWDGERCGPVQRHFHELITAKIRTTRNQLVELDAFATQLERAAEQLSGEPLDGPCGAGCACVAPTERSVATLPVTGDPMQPIACSLQSADIADRLRDWHIVLADASDRRRAADGAMRIEFGPDVDVAELARLVAAERLCCSFLSFAITVDHRGTALEVRAPDEAAGIVAELFGMPR